MSKSKIEEIHDYLKKIKAANKEATKREAFKDRLYAGNTEIEELIDQIILGNE